MSSSTVIPPAATSTSATMATHAMETNNGTITSFVAITTAFPSSSACSSAFFQGPGTGSLLAMNDPGYSRYDSGLTCLPAMWTNWWGQGQTTTSAISLGPLVCPEAYSTASTSVKNSASTQVLCCPSQYRYITSYDNGLVGECVSTLTSGQPYSYASYNGTGEAATLVSTTATTNRTVYGAQVNGWLFSEAIATSSSASSPSSSSTNTASPASAVTSTSTPSASPTAVSTASNNTSRNIGIGVGIGAAALIAIIAVAVWIFRRKRKANDTEQHALNELHEKDENSLLPRELSNTTKAAGASELGADSRTELGDNYTRKAAAAEEVQGMNIGSIKRQELPGDNARFELES